MYCIKLTAKTLPKKNLPVTLKYLTVKRTYNENILRKLVNKIIKNKVTNILTTLFHTTI